MIAGKDNGKDGKVIKVLTDDKKVVVEGLNVVKKHIRKQGNMPGKIIELEHPLDVSNVMLICPHTGKPTRIGISREDGKKIRISKVSGKAI